MLVRLESTMADQLDNAASAAGTTRAGFVRTLMAAHFARADGDQSIVSAPEPVAAKSSIAIAGTHVGRLTGALVQAGKAVRERNVSRSLHTEIEQTLSEARATLAFIREGLGETKR